MATRKRKIRRLRGSRTHGWGVSGQHRKSGMKGGRGRSGGFKHKWTRILRLGDDRSKIGFRSPRSLKTDRTINVDELENLTSQVTSQEKGEPAVLDLNLLGYSKLLGRGSVSRAYNVKVAKASEAAARKIQQAGGRVSLQDQ
ncbi:MAG: uL15 family ribosomal protein [Candidatus Bathyarchaeia archaeon]